MLRSVSKLFDKTNTFGCTQFIEEGTLALGEKAEYRTDKDLYHVIRLQRIIENIDKIATATDSEADAHSAYLRVRSELEEFRVYLCSDVSDSRRSSHICRSPICTLSTCSRTSLHAIPYCEALPISCGLL
jgi:hypothetical protein